MKVVIATGIFPPDVGGPATFVPKLASHWRSLGWEVEVVTYSDVGDEGADRGYPVHRISRELSLVRRYFAYFRRLWKSACAANVIFAQDPVAAGFPALLVALLRRKRLLLKIVGDFAWEHARVQGGYGGTLEDFQAERQVGRTYKLMRLVECLVARRADRVIVPSHYLAGIAAGWGAKPEKIEVIYNGVDLIPFENPPAKELHRIVTVGRLVPWKGIDTLIGALPKIIERVPDASLLIVGDGPDETRLRERVRLLKLEDRVLFTGRLSRENVARAIASGEIFALLSSYEGFSHQLVEACQIGATIIATDAGGNPEIVEHEKNGLLVPYGNADATARAILRLFENPGLAGGFSAAARRRADDFSVETQMTKMTAAVSGLDAARVLIISRDGTIADPASRGAARMRLYAERVDRLHVLALAKAPAKLVELAPNLTVEVIDLRRPWSAFPLAIRAAVRGIRKRGFGLISAQDPHEAGLVGLAASLWTKTPLLVEEHGGLYLSDHWRHESGKNQLFHRIGLWVLGRADAFRAVSRKIADDLRRRWPDTPLVELSVYTEPLKCRSEAPADVYGYVGRFVAQKNLPLLLEAFAEVRREDPAARLVMAGGGPLEADLRRLSEDLGVAASVEWIPFSEDVTRIYERIGTLVLSSDYEGWARVVVEALACGIPVVMTDVGCAGEVLRDGHEGRVVPIGDRPALVRALREAADSFRHQLWSAAARQRAARLETPVQLADRLTGFWKNLLGL